jgi:tRNA pseudouridine55 synthase
VKSTQTDNSQPATRNSQLNGIFNINKPQGLTSHDVVARVRRISGQKKVGHAGTLDPLATGVLPVVLGKATRLVEYLADADKAYSATLALGATTDTYDREGALTPTEGVVMPSLDAIEKALEAFRGEIEQLPPMHSAIKIGGKKLYELARKGADIERATRRVAITRLELKAYNPPKLGLFVECSKGTYIRSLAHDLGNALGTGAYLDELVRTRHGPFTLEAARTLETLEEDFREGTWRDSLYPPEYLLAGWRSHIATPEEVLAITQGKSLHLHPPATEDRPMLAAKSQAGDLLAVLYWDADRSVWHPRKVFV